MIPQPFFPNPSFGWAFYFVLIVFLALAAYIDLRTTVVPKSVSVTVFALGLVANLVRGAWIGAADKEVWNLGANGMLVGALDGLLFALVGFIVCFALFFVMWVLGACGGGDVKLFAAVGAWVGPYIAIWIFCLSTIILIVLLTLKLGAALLTSSSQAAPPYQADKKGKALPARDPRLARGLTYSLPLALAAALLLLWFFRVDLRLAQSLPVRAAVSGGYNDISV